MRAVCDPAGEVVSAVSARVHRLVPGGVQTGRVPKELVVGRGGVEAALPVPGGVVERVAGDQRTSMNIGRQHKGLTTDPPHHGAVKEGRIIS